MASAAHLVEKDYFTDHSVLLDPYDYFETIRVHGPVYQMRSRDVVVVTGFAEALEVLLNTRDFSSWLNPDPLVRSEEHTSELQSLMRISYAVFCLNKKKK